MMEILNTFNVLILTGAILIYFWIKHKLNYWQDRGILVADEGPIQTALKIILGKISYADRGVLNYSYFKSKGVKHGGRYTFFTPVYLPVDLDIIKLILQVDFQHFVDRSVYFNEKSDPLSVHIITLTGNKWKILRRKMSPTFTRGKVKMMFETLVDCTKGLHRVMDKIGGKELDIKEILGRYTTDVIGSCAFGLECNSLEDPDNLFRKRTKQFFEGNFFGSLKRFTSFGLPGIGRAFNMKMIPTEVSNFFMKVVKDTVEYREKNNVTRKDFMDLLIQLKNKGQLVDDEDLTAQKINKDDNRVTVEEIAAQVLIFFWAGFETSTATMTFCFYELGRNKEVQDKLRIEIMDVLKKYDGRITYEGVMEMTYFDQIVNETLRKYPPVPNLNRMCTEEYKVPGTDLVLEKGTKLVIPIIGIHRDPEIYPEPMKFDPDRFTEENRKKRPAFSFLPYGEGPRNCIGARFGQVLSKVGLIKLLSKYEFTVNKRTIEPLQYVGSSFIMAAKGGIWLDFKEISD